MKTVKVDDSANQLMRYDGSIGGTSFSKTINQQSKCVIADGARTKIVIESSKNDLSLMKDYP